MPLEIRLQTTDQAPQDVGTLEAVLVKVLVKGGGDDDASPPTAVKVELSNEGDLFFHYASVVDAATFRAMRDEQHLMVEFADFVSVLTRSVDNAIREPSAFLAVLVTNREGAARLDFIQNRTRDAGQIERAGFRQCQPGWRQQLFILELGELMCRDALAREESCGCHFREEHQHPDGEVKRDDVNFAHVAAWEFQGEGKPPLRNVEPLAYEFTKMSVRNYK